VTTLFAVLVGVTIFTGAPGLSTRYATHVGLFGGQTWFRWQFSGTPNEHYDVMYFDQFGDLRYYQTVTPYEVTTYPQSISYGPAAPTGFHVSTGSGPVRIDYEDGTSCVGTVDYATTTQRAGDVIHLTSRHTLDFDRLDPANTGPCSPDPDYIETWTVDDMGPASTMGPSWALIRKAD
jgi:hypothetical protein